MECDEFIDGYSSYRDGLLGPEREERFRAHRAACESCARYDRVVSKGTQVLRDLPPPRPSPDFLSRLRHRLYHVRDGIPLDVVRRGGAAAAAVTAVGLLAFAWLPFAMQVSVEVELPAIAVEEPAASVQQPTAGPGTAAETYEGSRQEAMPRLFGPGVFVGSSPAPPDRWYGGDLWPADGRATATGLAPGRPGPSFLLATGTSTAGGR